MIDAVLTQAGGLPGWGPFALMDLVGQDVERVAVTRSVRTAFAYDQVRASLSAQRRPARRRWRARPLSRAGAGTAHGDGAVTASSWTPRPGRPAPSRVTGARRTSWHTLLGLRHDADPGGRGRRLVLSRAALAASAAGASDGRPGDGAGRRTRYTLVVVVDRTLDDATAPASPSPPATAARPRPLGRGGGPAAGRRASRSTSSTTPRAWR